MSSNGVITVYSDYICPFCYLGRKSLDRYQESRDEPLEIDWRPFDLRARQRRSDGSIDNDVATGKDEEYYRQARRNVERLADKYDVEMAESLRRDVDSLPAQAASLYVKRNHEYEDWLAFDEAILDALWRDGRDIGDTEVLVEIAGDVGLDTGEVQSAVSDEGIRNELQALFREAHERNVTGVPTFVYREHSARGAVPPEQLQRLVEGV